MPIKKLHILASPRAELCGYAISNNKLSTHYTYPF